MSKRIFIENIHPGTTDITQALGRYSTEEINTKFELVLNGWNSIDTDRLSTPFLEKTGVDFSWRYAQRDPLPAGAIPVITLPQYKNKNELMRLDIFYKESYKLKDYPSYWNF